MPLNPVQVGTQLGSRFEWLDWTIVVVCLAVTTWLGHALAGKQRTVRDFWLGGRTLPWYAVSGSIVATQLSATTFIVLPLIAYKADFRYIQLALFGQLIARFIVGYWLLPAYYEREIYSPYDYMARRLGVRVKLMTTALFCIMAVVTRAARVYLTAVLVELLLAGPLGSLESATGIRPLVAAMWLVGGISMAWTLMGGINTVVWTDVILFVIFLTGAIVSLFAVAGRLPGGFGEMIEVGRAANKFRLFDVDPSPARLYTIWTAVIAASFDGIAGLGTDQTVAQRLFCCRNVREARKALISSWLGICVPILCLFVGVALFAYYQRFPMDGTALDLYRQQENRLFPIFILSELPSGVRGLIVAGIIAAAVASLESVQAALSQATLSALYLPWRRRTLSGRTRIDTNIDPLEAPTEQRRTIRVSRWLIAFWSVVLCFVAMGIERVAVAHPHLYPTLIELMGQFTGYTAGALFAGFVLAFFPQFRIDGTGFLFAAPLSVLMVFATVWHEPWTLWVLCICGAVLMTCWVLAEVARRTDGRTNPSFGTKTVLLFAGIVLSVAVSRFAFANGSAGTKIILAWPWYIMIGTFVAVLWGWLLAIPVVGTVDEATPSAQASPSLTTYNSATTEGALE